MLSKASSRTQITSHNLFQSPDIARFEEQNKDRLRAIKNREDGWERKLNDFCKDARPLLAFWATSFLYMYRIPGPVEGAEDAAHDYLLRFIKTGISKFEVGCPIAPFLRAGLRNACQTIRQKYQKHSAPPEFMSDFQRANTNFDVNAQNDQCTFILEKIAELPDQDRRLILLVMNGVSGPDAALEFNISIAACRTRICRIRADLQNSIFSGLRPAPTVPSKTVQSIPNPLKGGPR